MTSSRFAAVFVLLATTLVPAQDKDPKLTPKQRSASKLAAEAAELMKKGMGERHQPLL